MKAGPTRSIRDFWDDLGESVGDAAAIDPKDALGHKNLYIALVRDLAINQTLTDSPADGVWMDFGCGTGTFLSHLKAARPRTFAIGADVSSVMLHHAVARDSALGGRLLQYDGLRLPLVDECLDVITTGGVLLYFRDDQGFLEICREFNRALRSRGVVVAVEQVRASTMEDHTNLKVQRSADELVQLFEAAGFECEEWRQIRRGRFPLVYAIRYGLVPRRLHGLVAKLESYLWRRVGLPRIDYADAVFKFRKTAASR